MEDILKHPAVFAIALAGAVGTSLVNIVLSTDPTARPDAYTASMASTRAETVDRRLDESESADRSELQWRAAHEEWGRAMSIKQEGVNERHEAQIQELYRRIP